MGPRVDAVRDECPAVFGTAQGSGQVGDGTGVGAFGGVAGLYEAELYMRCMKNK